MADLRSMDLSDIIEIGKMLPSTLGLYQDLEKSWKRGPCEPRSLPLLSVHSLGRAPQIEPQLVPETYRCIGELTVEFFEVHLAYFFGIMACN